MFALYSSAVKWDNESFAEAKKENYMGGGWRVTE